MTVQIEKNVAMPPSAYGTSRRGVSKYPLASMDVGDSFFIAGKKVFTASISYVKANPDKKFSWRKVTEKGIFGVRVWRVK